MLRANAAVLAAGLTSLVCAAPALAISDSEAVGHLNAQRSANGIPGDVALSPKLSDGCDKHNNYQSQNGGLQHGETEGNPGWTPEGSMQAPGSGGSEVLTGGGGAWDDAWENPWAAAPIHLLLMFQPTVSEAGYADSHGFTCMRLSGYRGGLTGAFSLPGNGVTEVPTQMDSRYEGPYSPNDVAGVPEDQAGYNVLLWHPGATADIASASLTGPGGAAEIRTVDSRSQTPGGGTFNWGGSVVVPVRPLDPGANYTLDVTFTDGTPYRTTFRTRERDPHLTVQAETATGLLRLRIASDAPVDPARASTTGPAPLSFAADPGDPLLLSAPVTQPGTYVACVDAGGPATGFSAAHVCATASVVVAQKVSLKALRHHRLKVVAAVPAGSPRTATVAFRSARGGVVARRRFKLTGSRTFKAPRRARKATVAAKSAGGYLAVSERARLRR